MWKRVVVQGTVLFLLFRSFDPQKSLVRLGARTHGIDASESNISIAKVHASADPKLSPPSPLLSYEHTSAESLLTSPKRYDVVCSMEVLEHVGNPASFLSTCATLIKVGLHPFILSPSSFFIMSFSQEDTSSSRQFHAHPWPTLSPSFSLKTFSENLAAHIHIQNSSSPMN